MSPGLNHPWAENSIIGHMLEYLQYTGKDLTLMRVRDKVRPRFFELIIGFYQAICTPKSLRLITVA